MTRLTKKQMYSKVYYTKNRERMVAYGKTKYAAKKLYAGINLDTLATLRPLRFWGTPTVYLFISDKLWIGKGHNKLTAVKDALFNLRRTSIAFSYDAGMKSYSAWREWLLNKIETEDLEWVS